jgi:hypothetical protein
MSHIITSVKNSRDTPKLYGHFGPFYFTWILTNCASKCDTFNKHLYYLADSCAQRARAQFLTQTHLLNGTILIIIVNRVLNRFKARASIHPKKGGDGLQIRKVRRYATQIFFKFWYLTEMAFQAFWRNLYKSYSTMTNVHDLKSIFNHVRNRLKNKVVQVW